MAYVRGEMRVSDTLFLPKEGQYINLKNEISSFWESAHENEELKRQISDEIAKRSPKLVKDCGRKVD